MPEAAVEEDCHPSARERYIRTDAPTSPRDMNQQVLPEAVARPVQERPDANLGKGVSRAVALSDGRGGR